MPKRPGARPWVERVAWRRVLLACTALALVAPLVLLLTSSATSRRLTAPTLSRPAPRGLPLTFEANRGQAGPEVKFLARGHGFHLFLTSGEVIVVRAQTSDVLRLRFVSSAPQAAPEGWDALPGRSHYLVGSDPARWVTDVPLFGRVGYRGLYPGVDLVFYGGASGLEHDFVVAPGASPEMIRLAFSSAANLTIAASGDLAVEMAHGAVRFGRPVAYQDGPTGREPVSARYVLLAPGEVGFAVGAHDRGRPLIIDPVVTYATYLGGGDVDVGTGIAIDGAGNAYITGSTSSVDFPTTAGALQRTRAGGSDAFVAKLDPSGSTLIYATYLGGSDTDAGMRIAVDPLGAAYVTGRSQSDDFPTTPGAFQRSRRGATDAFVAKLAATGSTLIYATYLGGSDADRGADIAVGPGGAAYVTGGTRSGNFPVRAAVQPGHGGGLCSQGLDLVPCEDAFVASLDPTGSTLLYSTYLGGLSEDAGAGIAADGAGNAYVTGSTSSLDFPTTVGAFQRGKAGDTDAFVAKLGAGGSLLYSTYLGGIGNDAGSDVAVDGGGSAYVTGATPSQTFPSLGPVSSRTYAFVTKLNAAGSALVYSRTTASGFAGYGIAVDGLGQAYIAGSRESGLSPLAPQVDAFVEKLDSRGFSVFALSLGGSGWDDGFDLALDGSGHAYVTGDTGSTNFPVTTGAFQTGMRGGGDAFVARIDTAQSADNDKEDDDTSCFIAISSIGSPLARDLGTLREVRDRTLIASAPGRWAVRAYYWLSPSIAHVLKRSESARAGVRVAVGFALWAIRLDAASRVRLLGLAMGALLALPLLPIVACRLGRRRGTGKS